MTTTTTQKNALAILEENHPGIDFTAPVETFTFGKSTLVAFFNSEECRYEVFLSRKAKGKLPIKLSHSRPRSEECTVKGTIRKNAHASILARAKQGARNELKKWSRKREWKNSPAYQALLNRQAA